MPLDFIDFAFVSCHKSLLIPTDGLIGYKFLRLIDLKHNATLFTVA